MEIGILGRVGVALCAVVLATVNLSPAASAAPPDDAAEAIDGEQLAMRILESPDPEAEMAKLSKSETAAVTEAVQQNLVADQSQSSVRSLGPSEAVAVGLTPPGKKSAARGGCWSHYYFTGWSLWGMEAAQSWMQLNWCGSGGRITDSSITNVGGAATGIGYGGNTKAKRNVGWEVRGLTTHEFSFYLASVTKCMQIRGGATGLYSRSTSCQM